MSEKGNGEIVKVETKPLTTAEVIEQVQLIQQVLNEVMKLGTHYDKIAGCGNKSVLLKPGAEKILSTFRIGTELKTEDLGDGYDFRYRVTVRGFYVPTGNTIGYGIGEASTKEKKYAWKEASCRAEYDDTPETRRRIYWKPKKDGRGYNQKGEAEPVLQVRQDPADIANTVLKMAKKRAMVDLCLTATACSDIFEQDLDEPHIREATGAGNEAPKHNGFQKPRAKTPAPSQGNGMPPPPTQSNQDPNLISGPQVKRLYAIAHECGIPEGMLKVGMRDNWGIESAEDIPRSLYNEIISWIQGGCQEAGQ